MSLQSRRCWIMCYFYLLLVPFYTVFVTNPCIDWWYQSPTCPKPDPRVATRPLPRSLYFWYLVQFETYIVVTVYCPCQSIKHQVVEMFLVIIIVEPYQSIEGIRIVLERRATQRSRLRETFRWEESSSLEHTSPSVVKHWRCPPAETWSPANVDHTF